MIDPRYLHDALDLLIQVTRRAEAAEERCKALSEALRALVGYEQGIRHGTGHAHRVPGRWNKDGSPCVRCGDFERARALLEES